MGIAPYLRVMLNDGAAIDNRPVTNLAVGVQAPGMIAAPSPILALRATNAPG